MKRKTAAFVLFIFAVVFCLSLSGCKDKASADHYKLNKTEVQLEKDKTSALIIMDYSLSGKNYTTTWTSENPAIVTVSDGFITGVAAGETTVTASVEIENAKNKLSLACTVKVIEVNVPLTGIGFNKDKTEVYLKSTFTPSLVFIPANASNQNVTWTSSDESVISFSNGAATANKLGTATITAVSEEGGYKAQQILEVVEPKDQIESFSLDKTTLELAAGESEILVPTFAPAGVTATIEWTSTDDAIATVSNGTVSAIGQGKAVITATVKDIVTTKTAKCTVTVTGSTGSPNEGNESATKITFDKSSITVFEGDKTAYSFIPTVTPESASKSGVWSSSEPAVVSVDSSSGKMSICSDLPGNTKKTVTITYKIGNIFARGVVIVKPHMYLNESDVALAPSETFQLKASFDGMSAETISYKSSDSAVAKVDSAGKVTAVSAGSATITASCKSGYTATCSITVSKATVVTASLAFSGSTEMKVGDSITATIEFSPGLSSSDDLNNLDITVTSSDSAVKVSKTATLKYAFTAQSKGPATISINIIDKSGKYSFSPKTAQITVSEKEADTKIVLSSSNLSMKIYGETTLSATVSGSGAQDEIVWSTSSDIISINESSDKKSVTIKAVSEGNATIYAKLKNNGQVSAVCTVSVTKSMIEGASVSMRVDQTLKISPSFSSSEFMTWTSNNPSVVTIDPATGMATAKAAGKATITIATPSKIETVLITVTAD